MAQRTASGYVFGGLAGSRTVDVQFATSSAGHLRGQGAAGGVFFGRAQRCRLWPRRAADLPRDPGCAAGGARARDHRRRRQPGPVARWPAGAGRAGRANSAISLEQPEQAMPKLRSTLVGLTQPQHMPDDAASAGAAPRARTVWSRGHGAPPDRSGSRPPGRGHRGPAPGGHAPGVLRAPCAGGAGRSHAGVRRDSRRAGARRNQRGGGRRAGRPQSWTARCPTPACASPARCT